MRAIYLLGLILSILAILISSVVGGQNCKASEPCIFIGKDLSLVKWQEPKALEGFPYPPKTDSWSKPDATLFISIASFRDKLCPITLFNAYSKAEFPTRIHVGVVQQNLEDDVDCFNEYCRLMKESGKFNTSGPGCPFEDNIRMNRVSATKAKGPTWGRALASAMLQDEEFCMQTDAHMDFVQRWDSKMMRMWADTNNEYAVLSTYVAESSGLHMYEDGMKGLSGLHEVPHLCMVTLEGAHSLVRNWGTKCMRMMPKPKLTNAIWGAGLSFSKCHAERKVPYDPHTPHIFDGEEFSRAVRFWTYGYDIYTPHRVYVVHNYHASQSDPKHFGWYGNKEESEEDRVENSVFRLKTLFQMPGGETDPLKILALLQSKYGLGDRRTYDQLIEFSGIDTRNRKILGNRCGNLDLVPFKEHPWGADYIPKYDPVSEVYIDARDPDSVYFNGSDSNMKSKWLEAQEVHQEELQLKQQLLIAKNDLKRRKQEKETERRENEKIGSIEPEKHTDTIIVSPDLSKRTSSASGSTGIAAYMKGSQSFYIVLMIVGLLVFAYMYRHSYHVGKDSKLSENIPDDLSTVIKTI